MLSIAICDDDAQTCAQIENVLLRYQQKYFMELEIEPYYTGESLWQALQKGIHFDLIFLDIELVTTDGVLLAERIRWELQNELVQIVYISIHEDHALRLFRTRPLNFLVKPLTEEMIMDTVQDTARLLHLTKPYLTFTSEWKHYKVPFADILYLRSQGHKILVVTAKQQYSFYGKLSELDLDFAHSSFIVISKSYIVNYLYIAQASYQEIKMTNGDICPISQSYRSKVRQKLMQMTAPPKQTKRNLSIP